MAVVPSDLATGWSVRYETLFRDQFNQSINIGRETIGRLVMPMELGDFQGNKVTLDWLGASPQMREWVDEKRAIGLAKYTIDVSVKRYEATVEIDLDALRDARGNVYDPRIREIAANGARLSYNLVSDLVKNAETGVAYDGQNFFDTDHSEGDSGTQSNELTGTGTTLAQITADFYGAKKALMTFKDDKGEVLHPVDFRPLIWLPADATIIQRFEELQNAVLIANGETNILRGAFDKVVDPRLTDANDWHMFRADTIMKPFFEVDREEVHYEDNFGSGHPDVWSRRVGQAGAVGRMAVAYGMWQCAVKVKNA